MFKAKLTILTALTALSTAHAATISYTGLFTGDSDVELLTFSLPAASAVTIQTLSFAGGVNAAGKTIAPGGFSPDIWLFDTTGTLLLADSPESPDHAAPSDCGPRAIDPVSGFCWDAYFAAPLTAGTYTVALTQDGNVLADGYSLAGGFTEQGVLNYTDVNGMGGEFYLPDGLTERDGHWALDISGVPATGVPEPGTGIVALGLVCLGFYRQFRDFRR